MEDQDELEIAMQYRHDLGKYVWFRQRFTESDASVADRRKAAVADLEQTRKGPAGVQSAWEVFAELPVIEAIERADVQSRLDELRTMRPLDRLASEELTRVSAASESIARALSGWVRRLRAEVG